MKGVHLRIVYVDEAGVSSVSQESFVVVAGIILDADKSLIPLQRDIDRIVARHIPKNHQAKFIFHAHELFNGRGKFFDRARVDWPLTRRLEIADELAALPKRLGISIALGWVERATLNQRFPPDFFEMTKTPSVAAHAVAFMSCAMQVEMWMRRIAPQEVCMLVIEDNKQAKGIITETQHQYQDDKIVEILTDQERKYFPFRKIKEIPLFAEKNQSKPLQLADFCAYVFKRKLMGDSRYDRFIKPLRSQMVADKIKL